MGIFSSVKATVPFNVLNHDPTVEVFLYICMYQTFLILSKLKCHSFNKEYIENKLTSNRQFFD